MPKLGDPLLTRSELTGRVYVVTAYKRLDDGTIEARTKYDVTEQYEALTADLRVVIRKLWAAVDDQTAVLTVDLTPQERGLLSEVVGA